MVGIIGMAWIGLIGFAGAWRELRGEQRLVVVGLSGV